MEFKYKSKKKKSGKKPLFKVIISFMIGDADSYETEEVTFGSTEEDISNLKNLILSLEICNNVYRNGKGGYDEYSGIPEYDAFFTEEIDADSYEEFLGDRLNTLSEYDCVDLIIDEILNKINPSKIHINHPSCSQGTTSSFDGYRVTHRDENGVMSDVTAVFSEGEKAKIESMLNYFD